MEINRRTPVETNRCNSKPMPHLVIFLAKKYELIPAVLYWFEVKMELRGECVKFRQIYRERRRHFGVFS